MSVRPSQGPEVAAALPADRVAYDWGGGLVWLRVPPGTDVGAVVARIGGHAARVGGPVVRSDAVGGIVRALKASFDPRGILNPGVLA